MQADGVPGVEIMEDYKINIRINSEGEEESEYLFRTPLSYDQVKEKIVIDDGAYVVRDERGEKTAVFDASIESEKWGNGERWIIKAEAVIFEPSMYEGAPEYNPDWFVQVETKEEYFDALRLGYLFRPGHPGDVIWPDQEDVKTNYCDDYSIQDPLPYSDNPDGLPFRLYNNIMYKMENGYYAYTFQEAVFNRDGSTGVMSFLARQRTSPSLALRSGLGMAQGGDGSIHGNYILPFYKTDMEIFNRPDFILTAEIYERAGLFPGPDNIDVNIKAAVETMLVGDRLPTTINGYPTWKIGLSPNPFNIVEELR
jgi:hypothetical protein